MHRRLLPISLAFLAAFDLLPGAESQAEPALKRGLRILAEDAGSVFSAPARWRRRGWLTFSGIVVGTALLVTRDEEIRAGVNESNAPDRGEVAERIEELGRPEVGALLPLISYGLTRAARSPRLQETSLVAFEAWVLTAASTAALKGITARRGPADGGENDFWKGGDFFPSGHTSRTFAIAAAIAERHGRRAAWIAYPLAALVGLARVETGTHWASDVPAGAALGIAIGRAVARRHPAPAPPAPGDTTAPRRYPAADQHGSPGGRLGWSMTLVQGGVGLLIRVRPD